MSDSRSEVDSDTPTRLRALSDEEKGQAIARGLERLIGHPIEAQIRSVIYGAFDRLRTFRQPAEIRVELVMSAKELLAVEALQWLKDQDLEEGVAASLSEVAGEPYAVRLRSKRYDPIKPALGKAGSVSLTLQVGRCDHG